ncbi:hypothetical protein Q31b_57920 [Novipirellula aureliae]|uniref:Uncharacterized protein n=1 Tax=Novipirellula aureliae TaxID=2527966 RepID=A0A5C6D782_9BACT|nr:hypothetical protein Q31b_57920 [Novipirellula aureliae]
MALIELKQAGLLKHARLQFPNRLRLDDRVTNETQTKSVFRFEPSQAHGGVEYGLQFFGTWEFTLFGRNRLSNLSQLLTRRQRMVDHDEQLFEFRRDLNDWRQYDENGSTPFSINNLSCECLNDLGGTEEPMKVRQNDDGRSVIRPQRLHRVNRGQRVRWPSVIGRRSSRHTQALVNVPGGESPLLCVA